MNFPRRGSTLVNIVRLIVYPSALVTFVLLKGDPRLHQTLPLLLLGGVVLAELILLGYSRSKVVSEALELVRREHALFKAAAEGSQQAFYACTAVWNGSSRVTDFCVTYMNEAAEKLFERNRLEFVGQSASMILPSVSRLSLMSVWSRVAATGVPENMEMVPEDGEGAAYTARVVPLPDGVGITILNGFDADASARRLEEVNNFAQSIIQSAPISMIATDLHGTVIAMNSAAERLTLYRRRELIGEHSMVLLHDPQELSARAVQLSRQSDAPVPAGFHSIVANMQEGAPEEREWTYVRKDGSRVSVNLTMSALRNPEGKITGYLGIAFDMAERKDLVDSMVHLAHHDQLTGLPNRVLLNDRMVQGIDRSTRFHKQMAVFLVDIDHFKRINDSLGHSAGDELLMLVARQLKSAVRRTDTVARVGGDEFVVLMPDFGSAEDAERCAALMLQKIAVPHRIGNREVSVTASIGYCLYPSCGSEPEELLRCADIAMYQAKAAGRGCAHAFSSTMARDAADKFEMEEELRRALANGEFKLHYQPQVRCATGEVVGMEALLRWDSPTRGSVSPADFIPIADECGLLVAIGEWALKQSCMDCVAAANELRKPLTVAVNLSPRQFNQPNLQTVIERSLETAGLPAECLEIEITEQLLMADTPSVHATLEGLRELGVCVAIDDFGKGFSNLSYVMQYKVDRLKIDQSFVARSTADPGAASVVRTIIAMAHGLKIDVVAEGVERIDQLNFLLRKRCDVVQGYLFSRAVPIQEFAATTARIEAWVSAQQEMATMGAEDRRSSRSVEAISKPNWQVKMIAS